MASIYSRYKKAISLPHLSGSALKVIAIISMVVDHCVYYSMENDTLLYEVMRCFGRIAFPVFAFLIAEGFRYTRNRMRYFLQLQFFAVISEIPWYLLNGADGTHNVMFTLALGVVALAAFEKLKKDGTLCCCVILFIVVFYLFGLNRAFPPLNRMLQLLFAFSLMMHYGINGVFLASVFIFLYDGTRGKIKSVVVKYSFYTFYPFHLICLYLIILLLNSKGFH